MCAGECLILTVSCGNLGPRPVSLYDLSGGYIGHVMEGPVLVVFLDSNDGWVKFLVVVKGGTAFYLGGGVVHVDVVGEEANISLVAGGWGVLGGGCSHGCCWW